MKFKMILGRAYKCVTLTHLAQCSPRDLPGLRNEFCIATRKELKRYRCEQKASSEMHGIRRMGPKW
jgi:hypothetical protein